MTARCLQIDKMRGHKTAPTAAFSFHSKGQQNVSAARAAEDSISGADEHHPSANDRAGRGDRTAARGNSGHGVEFLSRIELPYLLSVSAGNGEKPAVRRALKNNTGNGR